MRWSKVRAARFRSQSQNPNPSHSEGSGTPASSILLEANPGAAGKGCPTRLREKSVTPSPSPEVTHDVVKLVQNKTHDCEGRKNQYSTPYDKCLWIEHVTCPPLFSCPLGSEAQRTVPCRKALVSVLLQSPVWEAEVIRHFVSAGLREPAT
jgi:hypothetical protein